MSHGQVTSDRDEKHQTIKELHAKHAMNSARLQWNNGAYWPWYAMLLFDGAVTIPHTSAWDLTMDHGTYVS